MTTEILVTELERKGVRLVAQGQNLKLQAPADRVPSAKTIAELREKRAAILEYLRERKQAPATQFSSFPTPRGGKTENLESVARKREKSARWKDGRRNIPTLRTRLPCWSD